MNEELEKIKQKIAEVEAKQEENGRRYQIQENKFSKQEIAQIKISELKSNLESTDYVACKIADAYAEYNQTGDDHNLDEIIAHYEPVLKQREQWRQEIRELEKQTNEWWQKSLEQYLVW